MAMWPANEVTNVFRLVIGESSLYSPVAAAVRGEVNNVAVV